MLAAGTLKTARNRCRRAPGNEGDRGALADEEFRRAKELVLTGHGPVERSDSTARDPGR
ncbi:hypothetical protein [Streptomyces sp. TE5632]